MFKEKDGKREFAKFMLVVRNDMGIEEMLRYLGNGWGSEPEDRVYEELGNFKCLEVIEGFGDREYGKGLPLKFLSGLVNVQREQYDLPDNTHKSYDELLEDAVVKGDFSSDSLHLTLAVVVAEANFLERRGNGDVVLNLESVISMLRTCKRYVGRKKDLDVEGYIKYMENVVE